MTLSTRELDGLVAVAIAAATEAGEMIASSRPHDVQHKPGAPSLAAQVVTEIDHRSEQIIVGHLEPTLERFGLGLLTEERDDDGGRLRAGHFWCVDPLDGTLPFVEGSPGYAVSIALVARDGTPVVGVIHDPVEATLTHAVRGGGAFRDGIEWQPGVAKTTDGAPLTVFADRSFAERDDHAAIREVLGRIAHARGGPGVRVEATSGAVLNACRVLDHAPACYFKRPRPAGGGSLWDFAATACLFNEVGAVATDITGRPLDLNRPDSTFMHHRGVLFASDESLAEQIRHLHR